MKPEIKRQLILIYTSCFMFFVILLIALGFKFYYAFKTYEPVMDERYYEIGEELDQHNKDKINSKNRIFSAEPALSNIKTGVNEITVSYLDTENGKKNPIEGAKVSLIITKSSTMIGQIKESCLTDKSGRCKLRFRIEFGGRKDLKLHAEDSRGKFHIEKQIDLNG